MKCCRYKISDKVTSKCRKDMKSVTRAVNKLCHTLSCYYHQDITFNKIFNEPSCKCDKHGDAWVYRYHDDKYQLRILYYIYYVGDELNVCIVDIYQKQKNNNKYIEYFDKYNEYNPDNYIHMSYPCIHEYKFNYNGGNKDE